MRNLQDNEIKVLQQTELLSSVTSCILLHRNNQYFFQNVVLKAEAV